MGIIDEIIVWCEGHNGLVTLIGLISGILGILGLNLACLPRLMKPKKSSEIGNAEVNKRKQARQALVTLIEKVIKLDSEDSGNRFMNAFYDLQDKGFIIKCDRKVAERIRHLNGLQSFISELKQGNKMQGLDTEDEVRKTCKILQYLVNPLGRDMSKARVYINTAGENISSGYEKPYEECELSDLERERVELIGHQVSEWKKTAGLLSSCTLLIIGGMRDYFCKAIVSRICKELGVTVIVLVHRKSVSGRVLEMLQGLTRIVDNLNVREVDESTAREGHDLLIYSHYWQHEKREAFNDPEFHLRKGGLLIWMSAISRGAGIDDLEYVCEGLTPRNAQQVPVSDIGYIRNAIEYTKMDGMSNEKAWIHYDALGSSWGGGRLFFDSGFPRSFQMMEPKLENKNGVVELDVDRLCGAIKNFLCWYFLPMKTDVSFLPVQVQSVEVVQREQRILLNASRFALISVNYSYPDKEGKRQELIVEIGCPDNEGKCVVTLYPCTDVPINVSQLTEVSLREVLSSQYIRDAYPECKAPRKVIPTGINALGMNVCKVIARIKCPLLKHYLIYLQQKDRHLFVACLPFRMYLTQEEYDLKHDFINAYQERIDEFKKTRDADMGFVPYRMDSVTILLPYLKIKETLRVRHGIIVKDESTFFYKCYGSINKTVLGNSRNLKKLLTRMSETEQSILSNDVACVEKDRAFNKFGTIDDRLQILGCLNVHDVLLFGVKAPTLQDA